MKNTIKSLRVSSAALLLTLSLASFPTIQQVYAQGAPSAAPAAATLSAATIEALQEALAKQGIAVASDGVMSDETRDAIRKYQSQHHLPVTGEADKATLDKLGVPAQSGAAPAPASTVGQSPSPSPAMTASPQSPMQGAQAVRGTGGPMMQGMMQGMMQTMQGMMGMMQGQRQPPQEKSDAQPQGAGAMMSGPMMQGMMQGMMKTMQGMMGMMQGPTRSGPMMSDGPGWMRRGAMQGPSSGAAMDCPMAAEPDQASAPAMMQMMQGMMQMMQMMQSQMQSEQRP